MCSALLLPAKLYDSPNIKFPYTLTGDEDEAFYNVINFFNSQNFFSTFYNSDGNYIPMLLDDLIKTNELKPISPFISGGITKMKKKEKDDLKSKLDNYMTDKIVVHNIFEFLSEEDYLSFIESYEKVCNFIRSNRLQEYEL